MQFSAWEPIYQQILDDFGFSRRRDEEAGQLLYDLLKGRSSKLSLARTVVSGRRAIVCGNAPCFDEELKARVKQGELRLQSEAILAADGATEVLLKRGIVPDIVVTDLDGPFSAIQKANQSGSILAVHAHGDNLDALSRFVPQLNRIIGTVQCRPLPGLYNFGGFTDGDRAVFLARELGASGIDLLGFDFEDNSVTFRKKKKLAWAKKLIALALMDADPMGK